MDNSGRCVEGLFHQRRCRDGRQEYFHDDLSSLFGKRAVGLAFFVTPGMEGHEERTHVQFREWSAMHGSFLLSASAVLAESSVCTAKRACVHARQSVLRIKQRATQ